MNKRAVVLLSGGMDSAVALWWAAKYLEPVAALIADYRQRGVEYEFDAVDSVVEAYHAHWRKDLHWQRLRVDIPGQSVLTDSMRGHLDDTDTHGLPLSFVPGRNLILIGLAASMAYRLDCQIIVGGWTAVDNDYPDCQEGFLIQAREAASMALSSDVGFIQIRGPLLHKTKGDIVKMGLEMGVPFYLTRSCYQNQERHCGHCDSCLKRAKGFLQNGIRDPVYSVDRWDTEVLPRVEGVVE